ncbi:DNA repair protein SWI5 homolog, partial [Ornithorhynchus anatinus]
PDVRAPVSVPSRPVPPPRLLAGASSRALGRGPALDSPAGPRPPGLRRTPLGPTDRCRAAFRSPLPSPRTGLATETSEEALRLEIQKLKQKKDTLDQEISQLSAEGYSVSELEEHISLLHEYNDIKDAGQMLLGRLAVIRGVPTKELYPEFDLDVND